VVGDTRAVITPQRTNGDQGGQHTLDGADVHAAWRETQEITPSFNGRLDEFLCIEHLLSLRVFPRSATPNVNLELSLLTYKQYQGTMPSCQFTMSMMKPANSIRSAIAEVARLRTTTAERPELAQALNDVKGLQAGRFESSYRDFLATTLHGPATRFFLEDLYGNVDYGDRDQQFSRIAGSLQSFFPDQVIKTAVALAELHLQTELLDHSMAKAWLAQKKLGDPAKRYVACWRIVGATPERYLQLEAVIRIGQELDSLTRTPGLRMTLRMMRGPAKMAGLSALQNFLEKGFDTFSTMSRAPNGTSLFLSTIRTRESHWIDILSSGPSESAATALSSSLPNILPRG
jgi:hypothetical protein